MAELEAAERNSQLLIEHGRHQVVLDFDETVTLEPGLGHSRTRHLFASALAVVCRRLGVTFHLGISVDAFDTDGSSIARVVTSEGPVRADAVVLAARPASPLLMRAVGVHLPVYPAKGYTLTATVKDPERAPHVGGIDERTLVAWSRFGGELRMSATAEFVGYDRSSTPADWRRSPTPATSCSLAQSTGTQRVTAPGFVR